MVSAFTSKTAVVTGGTSGIGRAVVDRLFGAGIGRVVCLSRRTPAGGQLPQAGSPEYVNCDFRQLDQVQSSAEQIVRRCSAVDFLIHCAGVFQSGHVQATSVAILEEQLTVNFKAPYLLTQILLPSLQAVAGQIVFVNSSVAAGSARAGLAAYTASKYALAAFADALRAEVNGDGLRVLSVYPGRTATPMQEAIYVHEQQNYQPGKLLQPADVAQSIMDALALPRTAEVTDVHIRPLQK